MTTTHPWTDLRILSQPEMAKRAGLTDQTIRVYKTRGQLPPPDITIGDRDGWTEATADAWIATLPGRGHRSDLDTAALLRDRPNVVTIDGIDVEILWDNEWHLASSWDANAWHVERGTCARVAAGGPRGRHDETPYGWVAARWGVLPARIDGIPDAELGRALRILAATGEAYAAHQRVRADRAAMCLDVIRQLRAQADALPPGPGAAGDAILRARAKVERAVEIALSEGVDDADDLVAASGLTLAQIDRIEQRAQAAAWGRQSV